MLPPSAGAASSAITSEVGTTVSSLVLRMVIHAERRSRNQAEFAPGVLWMFTDQPRKSSVTNSGVQVGRLCARLEVWHVAHILKGREVDRSDLVHGLATVEQGEADVALPQLVRQVRDAVVQQRLPD